MNKFNNIYTKSGLKSISYRKISRFLVRLNILCSVFFMVACNSGSSSGEPKVGKVYSSIAHYHPSFYQNQGVDEDITISYAFAVQVTDPQGNDTIVSLFAIDKSSDESHFIIGGENKYDLIRNWLDTEYIGDRSMAFDPDNLDRFTFNQWEMVAFDRDRNNDTRNFEFNLPGGDSVRNEEFVYSDTFTGSKDDGVEGLEVMTIAGNILSFSSSAETFTVKFTATDLRAEFYQIQFFTDLESNPLQIKNIGIARPDSVSIQDTPLNIGGETTLEIPWSEINLNNGEVASDISGIHISLLDAPIEINKTKLWYSHYGVSEYMPLQD